MPTVLERELTFLASSLPPELDGVRPKRLVDVYVPEDPRVHPRLRLRKKGESYELTKKLPAIAGDASQHNEETIELDFAEFEALSTSSRRVEKDRYEVTLDGYRAEVDIFRGALAGLVLLDFEFDSQADLESFVPPSCCGVEVTQEEFIAGGLLAGRTYADIERELERFSYRPLAGA